MKTILQKLQIKVSQQEKHELKLQKKWNKIKLKQLE